MRQGLIIRGLAGHSHYHNIRHRKALVDSKRQVAFQKLSREIYASIKAGGNSDVRCNARLARALEMARRGSMPKERIERALQKADRSASAKTVVFEGMFPGGVGVLVRAGAERRNAVAGEIRALFSRGGGEMGGAGWMFVDKYRVVVPNGGEDVALFGMEEGAEEVEVSKDGVEMVCESFGQGEWMRKRIVERFNDDKVYGMRRREARAKVEVDGEQAEKLEGLFEALDDHEQVVEVVHNIELRCDDDHH